MKHSYFILILALAMFGAACGGGDNDAGGNAAASSSAATDFPPPSLTSAEVCEMVGVNDIVAIFGGISALADPTSNTTGCWYSVWDGEKKAGETTITLLNNGGRAGYEARVEFWESRRTVTPVVDFFGTGYDGDAVLVEGGGSPAVIVMHEGGNWVWEISAGASGGAAITERIARTVAGQV